MISSPNELDAAASAFKTWCKTQDLEPHEMVMLCEYVIGKMILANAKSPAEKESRLKLVSSHISAIITDISTQGQN